MFRSLSPCSLFVFQFAMVGFASAQDPQDGLNQLSRKMSKSAASRPASSNERVIPFTVASPSNVKMQIKFSGNFSLIPLSRLELTRKGSSRTWRMNFPATSMVFDRDFVGMLPGSYELRIGWPPCEKLPGGCAVRRGSLSFETSVTAQPISGMAHITEGHRAPDKLAPYLVKTSDGRMLLDGGVDMFASEMWFSFPIKKPTKIVLQSIPSTLEMKLQPEARWSDAATKTSLLMPGDYLFRIAKKPAEKPKDATPEGVPFSIPVALSPIPVHVLVVAPPKAEVGSFFAGELVVSNLLQQSVQKLKLQFDTSGVNHLYFRAKPSDVASSLDIGRGELKVEIEKLKPAETRRIRFFALADAFSDDAIHLRSIVAGEPKSVGDWLPKGLSIDLSGSKLELVPAANSPSGASGGAFPSSTGSECSEAASGVAKAFLECLEKNGWRGVVP